MRDKIFNFFFILLLVFLFGKALRGFMGENYERFVTTFRIRKYYEMFKEKDAEIKRLEKDYIPVCPPQTQLYHRNDKKHGE